MKVLIFEGIATSGKSIVISLLQKTLTGSKIVIAGESQTHEPIMEQREEKHIDFFTALIKRLTAKKPDLLIFDRLYLTQAFRTKCEISDYSEIEELLSKYAPLTVFLEVDEDRIEDRFSRAAEHRGSDYFKSRWTSKERAQYYIAQQRSQLKLLEQSTIPHQVFDTTRHNYEEVVQRIIRLIEEW